MDPRSQPFLASLTPFARILFTILLTIVSFATLFLGGMLLAGPLFGVGLQEIMTSLSDYSDPKVMQLLEYFQVLQSIGLFIIPAFLAGYLFERNSVAFLGMDRGSRLPFYLLTLVLMFVSLPVVNWMITVNESMTLPGFLKNVEAWMKETEEQAGKLTDAFMVMPTFGSFLFNLLMIGILPAIGEELMFRGLVQRLLKDWLGNIHFAIFLSAFLFSAMHMQFYGFIPRMALGMMFGYLYYWSGSLWVPVFAHLLNNGSAVIFEYLGQTGVLKGDYKEFGATENVFYILLSAVVTALILFLAHRTSSHKKQPVEHF